MRLFRQTPVEPSKRREEIGSRELLERWAHQDQIVDEITQLLKDTQNHLDTDDRRKSIAPYVGPERRKEPS